MPRSRTLAPVPAAFDLRPWAKVKRYRWCYEESFQAERDPEVRARAEWFVEVQCRRGFLSPVSQDRFAAYISGKVMPISLLAELLAQPGAAVAQKGSKEAVVTFPADSLDAVAKILGPKKRRPAPSAAVIAKATAALAAFRKAQGATGAVVFIAAAFGRP